MTLITNNAPQTEVEINEIKANIDINNEGSSNIYHILIDEFMKCSSAVTEYIDSKIYLTMDDEGLTSEKIFYNLVTIVLDEFQEVGIEWVIDDDDMNQVSLLRMIALIRHIVEPFNFQRMLQDNEDEYYEIVDLIASGDQDSIKQLVIYLYNHNLIQTLHLKQVYNELDYDNLTDKVVNDTKFLNHIEAVLSLFKPTPKEVIHTSDEYYFQVVKLVEQDRHDFFEAKNKLKENDIHIRDMTNDYDLDKLEYKYPYWVWCIDPKDLTESKQKEQTKYQELHKENNPHHIEYYIKKFNTERHTFTHLELIDLVCHHYHPKMIRDQMRKSMSYMLDLGTGLFTEENEHYMQEIATILMKNHK
jgi:hypothetical protein